MTNPTYRRLTLSASDKKIGGVCGGIAEYLSIDPGVVRIAVVIGAIFSLGAVGVGYLAAWAVMPHN